tara:strand:+ start:2110 stop:2763 length:654 start_codon:yes stop_codon:yes gene_type:complete
MAKKNLTPEQVEMAKIAIMKRLSAPDFKWDKKSKDGKMSEMDKKIMSILRIHGKDADLNSEDADSLRAYLSGFNNLKPEWLSGEMKADKKPKSNPIELYGKFEKSESKFNKRLDELFSIYEGLDVPEAEIIKKLQSDKRLELLQRQMQDNLDQQHGHGILQDYMKERQGLGNEFHPNIKEYLNTKYPAQDQGNNNFIMGKYNQYDKPSPLVNNKKGN